MPSYAPRGPAPANNQARFDLRSDTVTQPCAGMRAAMAAAEVGDDVYGDDPSVNQLEAYGAELLGFPEALFVTSGTQSNLCALLAHCGRGEEVIVGAKYHIFADEAAGASVLGGIALQPIPVADDGGLEAAAITDVIKEDDPHYPISRLLCIENTVWGRAVSLKRMAQATAAARAAGLCVHLDGARLMNAAAALGVAPQALTAQTDTVSLCLSKGLGAPVGSLLAGPKAFIARARRARKMLGGGTRQAGVLAAAGLYALTHNVDRLIQDHARAETLAAHLTGLGVRHVTQASNMVFFGPDQDPVTLSQELATRGVTISGAATTRLVLHKDIDDAGLAAVMTAFDEVLA